MLCKGNMNLRWRRKNGGNRWRGPRHAARILRGRARAKPIYSTTRLAVVKRKGKRLPVSRTQPASSLGGDQTDFYGVAAQNSGYRRILAGLLVQRVQSVFVSRLQDVNFFAHYQCIVGAVSDAGAGAIGCRSVHVFSSAHGVAHLAGKSLLTACNHVKIRKCSYRENDCRQDCPPTRTTIHVLFPSG